jgi:hypothetical protein
MIGLCEGCFVSKSITKHFRDELSEFGAVLRQVSVQTAFSF